MMDASASTVETARSALMEQIVRAHLLAAGCMAQVADGDLKRVGRETAEKRARLAIKVADDLSKLLDDLLEKSKNPANTGLLP